MSVNEQLSKDLKWFAETYSLYSKGADLLKQESQRLNQVTNESIDERFASSSDNQIVEARKAVKQLSDARSMLEKYLAIKSSFQDELAAHKIDHSEEKIAKEAEQQVQSGVANQRLRKYAGCLFVFLTFGLVGTLLNVIGTFRVDGAYKFQRLGNLVGEILRILVFIGIIYAIVKHWRKTKANELSKKYGSEQQELVSHVVEADTAAQEVSQQIEELEPEVAIVRQQAMEQAEYLLELDRSKYADLVDRRTQQVMKLYEELKQSQIIPDERDWQYSDEIYRMVMSGRAQDLGEALNLVDTKVDRDVSRMLSIEQIQATRENTKAIQETATAQLLQRERHHNEEMAQRELHRAQEAAMKAFELEIQARRLDIERDQLRVQQGMLETERERVAENKRFHDEMRNRYY